MKNVMLFRRMLSLSKLPVGDRLVCRSLRPSRMCKHCKGETDWQELELRGHALAEFPEKKCFTKKSYF